MSNAAKTSATLRHFAARVEHLAQDDPRMAIVQRGLRAAAQSLERVNPEPSIEDLRALLELIEAGVEHILQE